MFCVDSPTDSVLCLFLLSIDMAVVSDTTRIAAVIRDRIESQKPTFDSSSDPALLVPLAPRVSAVPVGSAISVSTMDKCYIAQCFLDENNGCWCWTSTKPRIDLHTCETPCVEQDIYTFTCDKREQVAAIAVGELRQLFVASLVTAFLRMMGVERTKLFAKKIRRHEIYMDALAFFGDSVDEESLFGDRAISHNFFLFGDEKYSTPFLRLPLDKNMRHRFIMFLLRKTRNRISFHSSHHTSSFNMKIDERGHETIIKTIQLPTDEELKCHCQYDMNCSKLFFDQSLTLVRFPSRVSYEYTIMHGDGDINSRMRSCFDNDIMKLILGKIIVADEKNKVYLSDNAKSLEKVDMLGDEVLPKEFDGGKTETKTTPTTTPTTSQVIRERRLYTDVVKKWSTPYKSAVEETSLPKAVSMEEKKKTSIRTDIIQRRLIAVDVEAFEHNQSHILEFGLSTCVITGYPPRFATVDISKHRHIQGQLFPRSSSRHHPAFPASPFPISGSNYPIVSRHWIVANNTRWRNQDALPDHREFFTFGESKLASAHEIGRDIKQWLYDLELFDQEVAPDMKTEKIFLTHGGDSWDLQTLVEFGVMTELPKYCFDTQELNKGLVLPSSALNLATMLRRFNIPHMYLHNAGNDSYYTLLLLLHFMGL